jgi:hypothetical protein
MRILLTASALLMVMSAATPSMADDYPWCVGEPNQASLECRFTSFAQCQGTAMGMGECYRNPAPVVNPASVGQADIGVKNDPAPDMGTAARQKRRTN